jgi:AraC family transcriptional regulator
MHDAVQRAVFIINERYAEPLSLNQLAEETFLSPFHFSRLFHRETGLPPVGYLRSMRLFQAKRLLSTTSMTVAEVVAAVGYRSVGTFTNRFVRATGWTPSRFRDRDVAGLQAAVGPGFRTLPPVELIAAAAAVRPRGNRPSGSIAGRIAVPGRAGPVDVLIAVFGSPAPQDAPVACLALTGVRGGDLFLPEVPAGQWHVRALGTPAAGRPGPLVVDLDPHPVTVDPGRTSPVELRLRDPRPTDPPIAFTLVPAAVPVPA